MGNYRAMVLPHGGYTDKEIERLRAIRESMPEPSRYPHDNIKALAPPQPRTTCIEFEPVAISCAAPQYEEFEKQLAGWGSSTFYVWVHRRTGYAFI